MFVCIVRSDGVEGRAKMFDTYADALKYSKKIMNTKASRGIVASSLVREAEEWEHYER